LEKNLLHNRQAKSLHKHFVSLERLEGDFRCEQCPKTTKIFLNSLMIAVEGRLIKIESLGDEEPALY
jgi:hypothetical protein